MRLSAVLAALGLALIVVYSAVAAIRRVPLVEPRFETIQAPVPGPVTWFQLHDQAGKLHTLDEWPGHAAIVLFLLDTQETPTAACLAEMERLARTWDPRRVLGLVVGVSGVSAPAAAAPLNCPFPIVNDDLGEVLEQLGESTLRQAFVLLPDGQVVYSGAIEADASAAGAGGSRIGPLAQAVSEILAGNLPAVRFVPAQGRRVRPSDSIDSHTSVTFAEHVAPLLWRRCAGCHRPGEVAPFPLLQYRDAARRASDLLEVVESGLMPPWKPHPAAGVFQDSPRLSAHEKAILKSWVDQGRPEGDLSRLPPAPRFPRGWQLGEPDLVLEMPEPFEIPAAGDDVYQFLRLPLPIDRQVTIAGLEFRPGNPRVVHHTRIYIDANGDAKRRDLADPAPGFKGWHDVEAGMDVSYEGLGAWTPGMTPRLAPQGVGRVLAPGSDVVLRTHYHPSGRPEVDRSRVGLYFAKSPPSRTMAGMTLCTNQIDIPPGEKRHLILLATRLPGAIELYSVIPHAHGLCREVRLAATLPDGTIRPLLWITDWDFDWQDQYRYALPVRLPKGAILTFAAYFDNTTENPRNPHRPPQRVRYGGRTTDEMCACHLEFLPDDPALYRDRSPFGL